MYKPASKKRCNETVGAGNDSSTKQLMLGNDPSGAKNGSFVSELEKLASEVAAQGARLRMRRETLRLGQKPIAKRVGISKSLLSEVERGIAASRVAEPDIDEVLHYETGEHLVAVAMQAAEMLREFWVTKKRRTA